jgi:hypothetical protein
VTIVGLLAGLFTLFASGFGLSLLLFGVRARIQLPQLCALSWLFGTGLISLLLWLGGMLLSGPVLQLGVAAIALAIAACGYFAFKRRQVRLFFPRPRTPVEWLLVAVIVLQCGLMFHVALGHELGWDGLFNWEIKARYAFFNAGVMPASYYSDTTRLMTHPAYPLWVPLTELWLYLWMGEPHQFWIKLLFPIYYVAGAVLLATVASRLTGRRWIGLLAAALLFFVPCLTNTAGGVHVGYVDVPISVLYLGGIGFLLLYLQDADQAAWRCSALCIALLPWAKKEGSVLWLVAVLCAVGVLWRQRRSWSGLLWLLPGVFIMVAWRLFCVAVSLAPSEEIGSFSFTRLVERLPRLGSILFLVRGELLDMNHWSIFWPLLLLAFVALAIRAREQRSLVLFFAIAVPIAVYTWSFFFSNWPDWEAHLTASISRLLLHVMPLAWLAVALAMRPPVVPAKHSVR